MIGSLRGSLLDRSADGEILIEVAGIGYRVQMPAPSAARIGERNTEVFVHVHHHIREDNQVLYGFPTKDDRVVFEALISAHGVGPSLGLAILSVHGPSELAAILIDEDVAALCLVPGIGKKTAARILVELKDKLSVPDLGDAAPSVASGRSTGADDGVDSVRADVRSALASLGYGPDEVRDALKELPVGADAADADSGELLKLALRRLASR